ncbi:MAG TPA: hypothetical protein VF163_20035 [Micromonosporaceae bacterium]
MNAPMQKVDGFTRLLIAMFATPAPFEIALGIVKRESYDFRRLAIILGTLAVLAVVLAALRRRIWWYPQTIVGYYIILVGLGLAAFGVTAAIWEDQFRDVVRWSAELEITVTALAPSLGLLTVAAGVFLVRDRHKRAKEELDTPLPDRITLGKLTPVDKHTAVVWQADDTSTQAARRQLIDLCQLQLSIHDLHFIALFDRAGECLFYLDFFDDDALANKATGDSGERRAAYVRHSRYLRHLFGKLDKRFASLEAGALVRVVLDVEKGAILYYDLGVEGFLVGVTLDQRMVDPTDWKLCTLANEILRARGRQFDDDFTRVCPACGATNMDAFHSHPPSGGTLVPLPRSQAGGASQTA